MKPQADIRIFDYKDTALREAAFNIREIVFIEEQQVERHEEFDEFEPDSTHLIAYVDGAAAGTARWRRVGEAIKLERFAVLPNHRRMGIGSMLVKASLNDVGKTDMEIYLHAQESAVPFYLAHGFEAVGPKFYECNIAHYKMIFKPQ